MNQVLTSRSLAITGAAILCLLCFILPARSGFWDIFIIEKGYTRNQTAAMAAAGNRLYLARSDGSVFLFDGSTFKEVGGIRETVDKARITCLAVDGVRLWVGTSKGLVFHNGRLTVMFTSSEGLSVGRILDVGVDKSKNVWVLGNKRLARGTWHGTALKWKTYTLWSGWIKKYDVFDLLVDDTQGVWIATSNGVLYLDSEERLVQFGAEEGLDRLKVTCLGWSPVSGLWVGAHDHFGRGTVYRLDGNSFVDMGTDFRLPRLKLHGLAVDGQIVWAAADRGLFRFDRNTWHRYSRLDGLTRDGIDGVLVTPDAVYGRTVTRYGSELNRLNKYPGEEE